MAVIEARLVNAVEGGPARILHVEVLRYEIIQKSVGNFKMHFKVFGYTASASSLSVGEAVTPVVSEPLHKGGASTLCRLIAVLEPQG